MYPKPKDGEGVTKKFSYPFVIFTKKDTNRYFYTNIYLQIDITEIIYLPGF